MNYSLDAIDDSPLGIERARHLLNRTLSGYNRKTLEDFAILNIHEALDILTLQGNIPDPPLQVFNEDPNVAFGESWVDASPDSTVRFVRKKSLRSWWTGLLLNQEASLREKMVLFWHNHFAVEVDVVSIPAYYYDYVSLIRENALGNFKMLCGKMTINTGMLKYLDGVKNILGSPNENYARELFELFTIGKGPLISDGNYTFYTEHDIQEGARVLTGWKLNQDKLSSYFNPSQHDSELKTFSDIYGNQSISDQGDQEYLALIDMIFAKKQTARSLVTKLYRWFLYYKLNEEISSNIIEPLTDLLYENDWEVVPVLRKFLSSQHFFDTEFQGCYIKDPAEFVIGTLRRLEVSIPEDLLTSYEFWNLFWVTMRDLEYELGSPPDVAGWPAYYKEPQFNQLWINSATLPQRALFIEKILNSSYKQQGVKIQPDVVSLAQATSEPSNPNKLISEFCELLLPVSISQSKRDLLKDIIIPGLPDFEWGVEWNDFISNPEDEEKKQAIKNALIPLLGAIMNLPEFHLQ
ncbi:MAG: DUF1800 domain-containing protein [Bacteroidales bacterium]|nr:DUF1800 domain-containing protein [Bacteroidales bacterium]MCF8392066.1 DUF1800 domain-containing protein [Bacteroidales bacterium]